MKTPDSDYGERDNSANAVALVVLSALVYAACWFGLGNSVTAGALCCAVGACTLLGIAIALDGRQAWLSPAFWAAMAILLVSAGRAMVDVASGADPDQLGIPINDTYGPALKLVSVGTWAMATAYGLWTVRRRPKGAGAVVDAPWRDVKQRIWQVGTVVVLLSAIFIGSIGGPRTLLGGRTSTLLASFHGSSGYLYAAPQWLLPCALYAWGLGYRTANRSLRVGGVLLGIASQSMSILLGDRSYFLVAVVAFVLVRVHVTRKNPRLLLVVIAVPVVVLLGIVLPRNYRDSSTARGSLAVAWQETVKSIPEDGGFNFLLSDDFSMTRNFALVTQVVPSVAPYEHGRTYLAALTRPVPKQLFPGGKPVDADTELNTVAVYRYESIQAGFSYTFVSEPYLNFGIAGIVAFGLLAGVLLRVLRGWFIAVGVSSLAGVCAYAAIAASMIALVRGNLGTDYQRVLYYLLPLAFVTRGRRGRVGAAVDRDSHVATALQAGRVSIDEP